MLTPGMMLLFPKGSVPEGWLVCDGAAYPESVSPALFSLLRPLTALPSDPPDVFRTPNATPFVPKVVVQFLIKT